MSQQSGGFQDQSGVVTPEAVLLDFEIAGIGSRAAALWIDYLIRIVILIAVSLGGAALDGLTSGGLPTWIPVSILTLTFFGVLVVYPVVFESIWGKTPGKMALGLKVTTTEGAPIDFRQASVRAAIGLFEVFGTAGVVAAIAMVANSKYQRVGDLAAGTMVLRQRHAAKAPVATAFVPPSGAEEYALTLDVSQVRHDEYDALRSFLVRAPQLGEPSRTEIGVGMATRLVKNLRTQPPEWLDAEGFLACVAAAYQRRFSVNR